MRKARSRTLSPDPRSWLPVSLYRLAVAERNVAILPVPATIVRDRIVRRGGGGPGGGLDQAAVEAVRKYARWAGVGCAHVDRECYGGRMGRSSVGCTAANEMASRNDDAACESAERGNYSLLTRHVARLQFVYDFNRPLFNRSVGDDVAALGRPVVARQHGGHAGDPHGAHARTRTSALRPSRAPRPTRPARARGDPAG